MSDPLRTPERTTPPREHDVPARWGRWQASQLTQHPRTPAAAARGLWWGSTDPAEGRAGGVAPPRA